jgi:cell division protein FtsQ
VSDATAPPPEQAPRGIRWHRVAMVPVVLAAVSSPLWARRAASSLSFFRVRSVEVSGVRYLSPPEVVRRLGVDTLASVWADLAPLARRVEGHPQVAAAVVSRRLPGTLVVRITENPPVALVAARGGLGAYDAKGRLLPIDPSRAALDLPVAAARDTALFRLLADLRGAAPALYDRVSEVRRERRNEVLLAIPPLTVRAMLDVAPARLGEILPVEHDLARRQARVAELDLRYRDQVIARLQ